MLYIMLILGLLTLLTLWIGYLIHITEKDAESQKFEEVK